LATFAWATATELCHSPTTAETFSEALVVGDNDLNFFAQDSSLGIELFNCQFDGLHVDFTGSEITGGQGCYHTQFDGIGGHCADGEKKNRYD
jgi:hypothetical protein